MSIGRVAHGVMLGCGLAALTVLPTNIGSAHRALTALYVHDAMYYSSQQSNAVKHYRQTQETRTRRMNLSQYLTEIIFEWPGEEVILATYALTH